MDSRTDEIILKELEKLAIFKLSLGSKELFHSNFLEFLWDIDHNMFIRIVNHLLPDQKWLPTEIDYKDYQLSREKENFDICIFHQQSVKKQKIDVYDLIIENKVKSIPYKEQLRDYKDKVRNNHGMDTPRFLLLSLVENFPDKTEIAKNPEEYGYWHIANYNQLKDAINREKETWHHKNDGRSTYVQDYCTFIGLMHELQQKILADFNNLPIFDKVDVYKPYRLHDIYIKLRCAYFLMLLKKELEKDNNNSPVHFLKNHGDIREKIKAKGIYLNFNIFRSVGQAAAFIYHNNDDKGDIHEIVIQGNQYRHGINSHRFKGATTKKDNIRKQNELWNACQKDEKDSLFLNKIIGDSVVQPVKPNKETKDGAFNGYNDDYVYRYVKIDNKNVSELLSLMAEDIKKQFQNR